MMTITNMIETGTRFVSLVCGCGHHGELDVSGYDHTLPVPLLKHRFTCSRCGAKPSECRPAWHMGKKHGPVDMGGAAQIIVSPSLIAGQPAPHR